MYQKRINIAVVGATGYVGLDLVNLLSKHPFVDVKYLCAQKNIGKDIKFFDKRIKKKLPKISNIKNVDWNNIDLIFLSLPNGEAQKIVKKLFLYKNLKFIDLSADFRLTNPKDFKKWYSIKHKAKNLIKNCLYSISEFNKNKIKKFRIISNPGCYPTSIQLALLPLISAKIINIKRIIIDSKSGFSGAGKNFKKKFKGKNIYKSIEVYGIEKHRHMSELDQEIKKRTKSKFFYSFNPHVIPTFRGLISSIYLELNKGKTISDAINCLKKSHNKNFFVKILKINESIGTGSVINTNFCKISVCKTRIKKRIVIFSALDNLIKGASGQAVQNMNLIYGLNEKLGLK